MTESQNQEQPMPESESEPTPESSKSDAKWTDKDMDKQKGAARKEGKQTAINELLGELEIESVDDLKELTQAFKTVEEETATEADTERKAREKAEGKVQKLEQERDNALSLADERLKKSELKVALMAANARPDRLAKLIREADLSEVTIEEEEVKGLEPVVNALKEEEADWFSNGEPRKPSGFDGVPPGDPDGATEQQKQENQEIAKRQIHRMF